MTKKRVGEVFIAPFDVVLSENGTYQPDIVVEVDAHLGTITHRACEGPPDLVVEILTPQTSQHDLGIKGERYALLGVRGYWMVDPTGRSLEVLSLRNGEYASLGTHTGEAYPATEVLTGLAFPVTSIFREE